MLLCLTDFVHQFSECSLIFATCKRYYFFFKKRILVESVISAQLTKNTSENNLYEVFQSAYKESNSTETALTRFQNDILGSVDVKKCALLVLLDLS